MHILSIFRIQPPFLQVLSLGRLLSSLPPPKERAQVFLRNQESVHPRPPDDKTFTTHALARGDTGAAVNQDGTEEGAEHLEALLCLVPAPQLDAVQDEECGGRRLLLTAA